MRGNELKREKYFEGVPQKLLGRVLYCLFGREDPLSKMFSSEYQVSLTPYSVRQIV